MYYVLHIFRIFLDASLKYFAANAAKYREKGGLLRKLARGVIGKSILELLTFGKKGLETIKTRFSLIYLDLLRSGRLFFA